MILDGQEVEIYVMKEPYLTRTDTYTKAGKHISSVITTASGIVVGEQGPTPALDVTFG